MEELKDGGICFKIYIEPMHLLDIEAVQLKMQGIYFVDDGHGFIKVGKTTCFQKRAKELMTCNPHDLLLVGFVFEPTGKFLDDLEKRFHKLLEPYWYRNEWYKSREVNGFLISRYYEIEEQLINVEYLHETNEQLRNQHRRLEKSNGRENE